MWVPGFVCNSAGLESRFQHYNFCLHQMKNLPETKISRDVKFVLSTFPRKSSSADQKGPLYHKVKTLTLCLFAAISMANAAEALLVKSRIEKESGWTLQRMKGKKNG